MLLEGARPISPSRGSAQGSKRAPSDSASARYCLRERMKAMMFSMSVSESSAGPIMIEPPKAAAPRVITFLRSTSVPVLPSP